MMVSMSRERLTDEAMLLSDASSLLRCSSSRVRWRTRSSSSFSQRSCCSRDSLSRTLMASKLRASVPTSSSLVMTMGSSRKPPAILREASVSAPMGFTTPRA